MMSKVFFKKQHKHIIYKYNAKLPEETAKTVEKDHLWREKQGLGKG